MIRNRMGLRARFLVVAAAVACWIPSHAAGALPVQSERPSVPTNVKATVINSSTIDITWDPPASGSPFTGYEIEWSEGSGHPFQGLGWRDVPGERSIRHSDIPAGTTAQYRVRAWNRIGGIPGGGLWAVATKQGSRRGRSGGTPGAPGNLTAVAAGPTSINLSWEVPSSSTGGKTISGYRVDWSATSGGPWTWLVNTVGTVYTHSPVPVGVTRYYQVRALYSDGTYGPPAFAQATTVATGIPGAPFNLRATADGSSVIALHWDAPTSPGGSGIIDYQVQVSATGGDPWTPLSITSQTSFRHTGLAAGVTRYYRVRARNANGFGPWTSPVSETTSVGTPPGPPRALTATAAGSSAIDLSWSAPLNSGSSAVTGYRIEWSSTRTGGWSNLVANTGSTRTTHRDAGLDPNTTRYYRVSAINSFGTGTPSNVDGDITPLAVPGAPGRLTAEARGSRRSSWSGRGHRPAERPR